MSVSEGRRTEEESSFWKISAERSRLEGEQADFQSLTPSQIKSLEKGEKPLPSYLRQVTTEMYQCFSLSDCILVFFLVQVTAARHFLILYFGNKASQFWSVLFLTNNRLKSSSKPNTCHLSYRAVHPQIKFSLKLRKVASVKPPQVSEKQMMNAVNTFPAHLLLLWFLHCTASSTTYIVCHARTRSLKEISTISLYGSFWTIFKNQHLFFLY